jgi:glucosamine--fructose-6-phosphate aminotransferase (isomerizing)
MAEQPAVLSRLFDRAGEIAATLRSVLPDPLGGIALLARGSSDHAGLYGRYLLESATGRPVSLVAPSLHSLYHVGADYRGWLVIAVSQSGATPEITEVVRQLGAAGARTLAVTNNPTSPLAGAVDAIIPLDAGPERAVPATKTVTATMFVFALLADAVCPLLGRAGEQVPDAVATVLTGGQAADEVAASLGDTRRLVTVARGYLYAAALESALKVRETTATVAEGFSAADLRHGPIAAIEPALPVLTFLAPGPAAADMAALETDLAERGARVIQVSPLPGADLAIPREPTELLAPIAAVVRGQQLARALALHRGVDPDRPPGLKKITST